MAIRKQVSAARLAAFEILSDVEAGAFSSIALAAKEPRLQPLDRALCHELELGVLRWQLYLDRIVEHFSGRSVASLDVPVLLALRIGLYQLRFLTRIPPSAAVNDSVNLVGRARVSSARPFVNAILRRAAREPYYSPAANISNSLERIAIETSHPLWLIERWTRAFGIEQTESFARANNETPPLAVRLVASESVTLEKLRASGATLIPSEVVANAWRINGPTALIREFAESGEIYVQDEASQLVATTVNAQAGECVLDLCAAPGSKTTLIAKRAAEATVFAMDVSARRLATVASTVALHHLNNVRLILGDAGALLPFTPESFDRILLDAPCSGTGTLRHNPEIRWRVTPNDIEQLSQQQLSFLTNAATVVRPGGFVVYSTCSVEREENEEVVDKFLASNTSFSQVSLPIQPALLTEEGFARTWPHRQGTDGFFVAMFQRLDIDRNS